jgi:hypothetical protein
MNGRTIAMAVCGLLLTAAPQLAHSDGKTKESKVKCQGINECKGKGACASATNDCAGMNACKGKGWLEVTAKECKDKKGTVLVEKKKPAAEPKK